MTLSEQWAQDAPTYVVTGKKSLAPASDARVKLARKKRELK